MRLNKYIAHQNIASRREADRLIKEGSVSVNGVLETNPAYNVLDTDKVLCDVECRKNKVYIKLFKPRGFVVSKNKEEGKPIYKLIEEKFNDIYPVGRLDKDSSGLIIFTNDGVFSRKIISSDSDCEKEYYVKVDADIPPGALKRLEYGISLDGVKLKRALVKRIDKDSFYITLKEGKNRQIRRMCNKVDLNVLVLKRIRIGGVRLETLELGCFEHLRKDEIASIMNGENYKPKKRNNRKNTSFSNSKAGVNKKYEK